MAPKTQKDSQPAVPASDPRAGETASQDPAPTDEDIRLEALLRQGSTATPGVDDWREANRRVQPGLDDVEREQPPIKGPHNDEGRGRIVREDETVADRAADADATDEESDDAIASDDA
jgi:hypothetical protein